MTAVLSLEPKPNFFPRTLSCCGGRARRKPGRRSGKQRQWARAALRAGKMDKLSMSLDDISKARAASKAAEAPQAPPQAPKPAAAAAAGGGGGAGPARRGGRKQRQAAAAPLARPAVAPAAAPAALICNNCGGRGHYARSCPSVAVAAAAPVTAAGACFGCGGPRKFRAARCGAVVPVLASGQLTSRLFVSLVMRALR
jgi:hypothetical protein